MRSTRAILAGLVGLFVILPARGESRPPTRLVHESADVLFEVPQPRRLAETLAHLDLYQQLAVFTPYREYLDSTPVRRGGQLLAYVEKQLGASWPELLDRLAGEGVLVAAKFAPNPAPVVFVMQGHDEKLTTKFFQFALDAIGQEMARQEGTDPLVRADYHGLSVAHAGKDFWVAQAGPAIVVANSETALHSALDRHLGKEKKSLADSKLLAESRQLLPDKPLACIWVSLDAAHNAAEAKNIWKAPRDDANLTVFAGSFLDAIGRSPYVCAGIYPQDRGFLLTARLPRGREGMGPDHLLHLAPPGESGTRPLLEPRGVLYSSSEYLDFARIWTDREKLYPAKQVKAFEEFDKSGSKFLLGNKVSKLLTQVAPYYRFVAVRQGKGGYTKGPEQVIPAFAIVSELREPEAFGKSMESMLRAAAFLGGFQIKMKLVEEKVGDCKLIGYRFSEDVNVKADASNFRLNFSPAFVRVGNQFVYSSTIELARELIDLLKKEAEGKNKGQPQSHCSRVYAAGGADLLEVFKDRFVVQTILDQAARPDDAARQVQAFIDLVRGLGVLDVSVLVGDKEFHLDFRLTTSK